MIMENKEKELNQEDYKNLVNDFNSHYIYNKYPEFYDKLMYMTVDKDIVISTYNERNFEFYTHFESQKIYPIYQTYSNKNMYYIKVFGFNLYINSVDLSAYFKIKKGINNKIFIPNYILEADLSLMIHDNKYNDIIDINYNYFYNDSMENVAINNNLFNNLEATLSYLNSKSLKLFIEEYEKIRTFEPKFKSFRNCEFYDKISNNTVYLLFKNDLTFKMFNKIFYFEKGRIYKFINYDEYLFNCSCKKDCFNINKLNFILFKDDIFRNSEVVSSNDKFISVPNYVISRNDVFEIEHEIVEKFSDIVDDYLYYATMNGELKIYDNNQPLDFSHIRCMLYGRVIKDYLERYHSSI